MLSREFAVRLSQLNRMPLATPPPGRTRESAPIPRESAAILPPSDDDLSQLPAGRECSTCWGPHWIIQQPLATIWPSATRLLAIGEEHLERARRRSAEDRPPDQQLLIDGIPRDVLLLDLETCGFAGSMVFLVGLLHHNSQGWVLTQLLARNYAEEKSMLQTLWEMVDRHRLLVTFNGKSFDWPTVHDRSTLHHLGYRDDEAPGGPESFWQSPKPLQRSHRRPVLEHCDLLHTSRRRWKHQLPNCKLQTLEQFVCGRRRTGDIPGRDIPQAYHHFVRSGDAWQMRSILHHNALDLITLLQLSLRVVS